MSLKEAFQTKENVRINKMIESSLIDWEGMIAATLYVGGCNFRCPFCYNRELVIHPEILPVIPEGDILSALNERRPFLDGICLSGGEPTIYTNLEKFLKILKEYGVKIKLDTNGSFPDRLEELIRNNLVDYVAMDIKNSFHDQKYYQLTGSKDPFLLEKIQKSINLIREADIDYEFRTTVIPGFLDELEIKEIACYIQGAKKYVLQNFVNSEKMLDPSLNKIQPYTEEKMQKMAQKIEYFVEKVLVR